MQIFASTRRVCKLLTRAPQAQSKLFYKLKTRNQTGRRPNGCSNHQKTGAALQHKVWLQPGSGFMLPRTKKLHASDRGRTRTREAAVHIFAITSPPSGVHIFAWLPAFATLRPNLAYFRLLPPYALVARCGPPTKCLGCCAILALGLLARPLLTKRMCGARVFVLYRPLSLCHPQG